MEVFLICNKISNVSNSKWRVQSDSQNLKYKLQDLNEIQINILKNRLILMKKNQ